MTDGERIRAARAVRDKVAEALNRPFDPDYVLGELERRARGLSHDKLNDGRKRLLEEIGEVRGYIRGGDARLAAIHALRAGAWAERLGIEIHDTTRQRHATAAAQKKRLEEDDDDRPFFVQELARKRRENRPNQQSFTTIMRQIAQDNDTGYERVRRLVLPDAIKMGYKPRANKK